MRRPGRVSWGFENAEERKKTLKEGEIKEKMDRKQVDEDA